MSNNMVFQWKDSCRLKVDAQKVGDELESIGQLHNAESVVKIAETSSGELHNCFEWDDSKAAGLHRLDQARYLLRMLVSTVEVEQDGVMVTITPRVYESVRFSDSGDKTSGMVYMPTGIVLSDPELRMQVTGRLLSTITEAETTSRNYEALCPKFSETRKKLAEAKLTLG